MKQGLFAVCVVTLLATPVVAQSEDEPSLMEQGMELFMEGLRQEMEPALRQFEDFADQLEPQMREWADQIGPVLADLMSKIDDINAYEAPEILPNGDIMIRHKPDAPPYQPPEHHQPVGVAQFFQNQRCLFNIVEAIPLNAHN